ncbi:hypothetical protein POM88_013532 [Heracleum sosnowskyi]|uniref:Uncharacterized protein n=1 Tax=Heracleum sosnowskyi TaxID=360622 RepID=A0AAD8IZA3_9APIA|nr:hypothetical protein POM88_013532 [Heracleum sosnowskyi]
MLGLSVFVGFSIPQYFNDYTAIKGHFFPEEDDKFIERVRATVEEKERQAKAAAAASAAKDAIAAAEESRKDAKFELVAPLLSNVFYVSAPKLDYLLHANFPC